MRDLIRKDQLRNRKIAAMQRFVDLGFNRSVLAEVDVISISEQGVAKLWPTG